MKNKITVSAPGKLMLLGEHAVVYDHPCLVTAVDQRMKATVTLLDSFDLEIEAPDVKVVGYKKPMVELSMGDIPKGAQFVEIAVRNLLESDSGKTRIMNGEIHGIRIETSSEFSSLFGFGSSSASTVCVIKALSELLDLRLNNKAIFQLAYQTVLDIQGKGSGFDVAAAIYGGTLYFVTGGKVIEPLDMKSLPILVGYSGIKADTVILINQVAKKAKKYPDVVEGIYGIIEQLVERAKVAILEKDWQTAGELMNLNQGLLESLGVSTDKLSQMIYGVREGGAFGAKLSGAGGGDCIVAFSPEDKREEIKKNIEKAGGQVLDIDSNVEGVRVEE